MRPPRSLFRSRDRRRWWTLGFAYAALLASCESPLAPDVQEVLRLEITPPVLTMVVGGTATLVARVYGADDALLPAAKVYWSTQDPTVVTVNQDGVVSAVASGTAQIAASSGGQSRTIAVTVTQPPIALVRITPPAGNVVVGGTLTLQGEGLDGTGTVLPNRLFEWASSAPAIATVNATGVVTGVSVGQATISATAEGKTGTALVTVFPSPVASITIQPDGGNVPAGGTLQLTATARDASGQPLTGRTLEWRSSNDAVATVSSGGLLTALSPGTVRITASAPGAGPNGTTPSASVDVTVLIAPVASAVIVPSPASVQVGQTLALSVNLLDATGKPLSTTGRTIAWSSGNSAVASVNSSGIVTGVAVGSATITASITTPGQPTVVQATAQITVSNQPVASVVVSPNPATVHVGYSRPFTAVTRDAAGQLLTGRAILWTSLNQAIASVDASTGVVTGVSQGSVQIRATSEGQQGVANVTIDLVAVSTVAVTPPSATLMPAQTVQLAASPLDSAGNAIQGSALGGRTTGWASGNTAAATVSGTGLVTAVAQGSANVSATIGGTPGQSVITVNPLPNATQLTITTQPSPSPQNDIAFPVQPVVQLKDASGANVATAGVVVQAAITPPGTGTLGGTLTATTNASGAATFTNLRITGLIGTRTLTFSAGPLTPATSANVNLQPGVPTQLALTTPPPSSANSGEVFSSSSVVQLRDVSGNDVPQSGVQVTATVQPAAGVTLGGGSATTNASGTATFSAISLTGPAGNYALTFSSGSLTPAVSGTIALSAGSGSRLSLSTQPSPTVQSGVPFPVQPVVQLRDGSNNPVAQPGVVVTVAILTGGGTLGGTTTATTNASGVATFSGLSISGIVGVRTLLFGASGYTTVTSNGIDVTPGAATALAIAVQPSSTTQSGAAIGTQPSVQVQDASGNAVAQGGVVVSVSLNGGGGTLIGATTATTSGSGVATFSGLGITGTVGTYSLSFTAGGLATATSGSITLTAGAASQLTITTQPGGATSGLAFTTQPAIQVRDAQGNPVSQSGITVTATIASGGGATLVGSVTATTGAAGLATFSGLGLSGPAGSYTLNFAAGGLTSVTSATITLSGGSPAQLVIQTQPAGAASGVAFSTQPVILVVDAQSNPVGAGVTVSASVNGSGATLIGSSTAQTNGSGLATFSTLGLSGAAGSYTLDFSSSGVPNVTSAPVALGAGAATQLTMATQPSSSVASGSALATAPAVQLRDGSGNAVSQAGVNVSVAIGAGASLTGSTVAATDASGVATFTGLGITGLVGSYTLTFSSAGLSGATSSAISVTPGPAAQLTISTQPPATATSGAAFSTAPVVQLRDASGNAVGQSGFTVSATLNGSGGSLIGTTSPTTDGAGAATFSGLGITGAAGSYTITFSGTGVTSATSSSITVTLPPTQLSVFTQPSGTAASGSAFSIQPAVQLLDAGNNPVSQPGVQVTASITGGGGGATLIGTATATTNSSGLATFTNLGISGVIGPYTLTFSASGLTDAVSGTINLVAGAAAQVVIITPPSSSASSGVAFATQPVLQLRDAAGNDVATAGVNVSASIQSGQPGATLQGATVATSASGTATFSSLGITGLVGNYTLTFTASGVAGTATSGSIALAAGAAAQLTITTQPGGAAAGQPLNPQPVIQVSDVSGNPVSQVVTVTASINSGSGSLGGTISVQTNTSGVAAFADLSVSQQGGKTLRFTATGVGSVTSSSFNISP